ncbi:haloacid dehalogenase type II [Candidatus Pelagibacter sp.]|uniref:haloacid dehalogenase type II n=1 Tax=Candidatus Pelagibacter sp. TaxID=2024849 RepID=UPI003F82CE27
MNYNDFKFLSFDCYGTLIDWESGIWNAFQPVILFNNRKDLTREKVLRNFALLESEHQKQTPSMLYSEILFNVHKKFTKENKLKSTDELDKNFGSSVPFWPAFADSADALRILKSKFKLVILSNVNVAGFTSSNRWLGVEFDEIYTAEHVGSYKPNPGNFEYMFDNLKKAHDAEKKDILHVAQSLFHDHVPAKDFGMNTVWIDRQNLSKGGNWGATKPVENQPKPDVIFEDLISFANKAVN